jgi:hypothetical protein
MMHLRRTRTAQAVTIHLEATRMGGQLIKATLSDQPDRTQAVVDGLLWWALDRKLDAFVAYHVGQETPATEDLIFLGVRLLHYVQTTTYHEAEGEQAMRIGNTITTHLPELHGLIEAGDTSAEAEHAELMALAQLIQGRIQRPGMPEHGIQAIMVDEQQTVAA